MNVGIMCSSKSSASLNSRLNNATVASALAMQDYMFVMGSGTTGSMGNIKEILEENDKEIIAVGKGLELDKCRSKIKISVSSTFERAEKIYENSDAIIFLDGGMGTISEFISFLNNKIEIKDNKVLLLYNEYGNYNDLLKYLEGRKKEGLIDNDYTSYFDIAYTLEELIMKLEKAENKSHKKRSMSR